MRSVKWKCRRWNVTEVAWFRSVPLDADSDAHAAADAERGAAPPRPQPLHGVQQGDLRAMALEDLWQHDERGNNITLPLLKIRVQYKPYIRYPFVQWENNQNFWP